ncbi:MAG TPA: hypothetical protein VED01_20210 [Burkholderiales bacterium]|nr:hypothetical protein [Burkholderiales bacterium]
MSRQRLLFACAGLLTGAVIALSAAFTTLAAVPAPDAGYGKLRLTCEAKASSLHVADAAAPAAAGQRGTSTTIVWGALIRMGPKNQRGESLRLGSSTSQYRCGRYDVRVSGGYLNPRPMGEGGAIEFPVIEIREGKNVIVPRTALSECEEALPRYGHFGECAKSWAKSISVAWNPATRKALVTLERAYVDKAYEDKTLTERYEAGANATFK